MIAALNAVSLDDKALIPWPHGHLHMAMAWAVVRSQCARLPPLQRDGEAGGRGEDHRLVLACVHTHRLFGCVLKVHTRPPLH